MYREHAKEWERRSRGRARLESTKERLLYPDDGKSAQSIARLQNLSKTPIPSDCPPELVWHITTGEAAILERQELLAFLECYGHNMFCGM